VLVLAFLLIPLIPPTAGAALDDDLQTMQALEADMQRGSLALLSVFKTMAPTQTGGAEIFESAKVIQDASVVRETREPDSRALVAARMNDVFEVLERGDLVLKIQLPDGREGWIDETAVQVYLDERPLRNVSYNALADDEMRRYMRLADDLFSVIQGGKVEADELAAPWLDDSAPTTSTESRDALIASYRQIIEYHGYAAYFHNRFVGDADLSLAAGSGFRRSLSAWGEALLGTSKFTTDYTALDSDEVDENLLALAFGGEVELSERSRASAGFAKRNEVNQTSYGTTDVNAAYAFEPDRDTAWRAEVKLHSFADDLNAFNDFQRSTLRLRNDTRRAAGRSYSFDYAFTDNSYENTPADDYTGHSLRASTRTGLRGDLIWRLRADLESSDAAFHDFTRLEPSVEWGEARGGTAWRALYEDLSYGDAGLRSYGRAEFRMRRTGADGPRRSETLLALSRKSFEDNDLQTYVQLRGRFGRTLTGLEGSRRSLSFYSNFFTEATENSYTDLRFDAGRTSPTDFRNLSVFGRVWHQPGDGADARAHVIDLNGRIGRVRGNIRYGPSLGAHFIYLDDGESFLERDGNLVRVGGFVEGFMPVGDGGRLAINASYEYGFVWTEPVAIANDGTVTAGETDTRHPTTFQINADAHMPLGESYDLSARLTLYRIATDMDSVYDNPAPGTVTDNSRATLFVGVRYRYN